MAENTVKLEIVLELLVKFVKAVIQIEKPFKTKNPLMKVLGIGNAIVDVICKVDDNFIAQNNLTKSTMKLVDEVEFKNFYLHLELKKLFLEALLQTQ